MEGTGTVTVLVTDMVGSTALRSEVGEETADRLRRAHDDLLSTVVVRHGGSVVKGVGDGIIATFPGAADAVERRGRRATGGARLGCGRRRPAGRADRDQRG